VDGGVTNALLTPWQTYGIIGSVVIALSVAVVFLIMWVRSLTTKTIERLERELEAKNAAYERLAENFRRRTREEPEEHG
jgi:uncharacterized protein (DUF2062 family)